MNDDLYRPAAERMLAGMRHMYKRQVTYRRADPSEFPHLDFSRYAAIGDELAVLGFSHLVDLEHMESSTAPNAVREPTLMRGFTSADRTVVARLSQVSPRQKHKLESIARSLVGLGWIAAPWRFARGQMARLTTRMSLGFSTELDDGTTIVTNRVLAASPIALPPQIVCESLRHGTSTKSLLRRHEDRVAARLAQTQGVRAVVISSVEDLLAGAARRHEQMAAHREAVGWLTREELHAMSPGRPDVADETYEEIQQLLRESAEPESH